MPCQINDDEGRLMGGKAKPKQKRGSKPPPTPPDRPSAMSERQAERAEILAELEGRINGTRGWFSKDRPPEELLDFKRWLEARTR